MKKIIAFLHVLAWSGLGAQSQSATQVVVDTVHYFFNKHYFKTGTAISGFPYYKLPFATQTLIAHAGTKFRDTEPLQISGLEAIITRDYGSTNTSIPVRLYLCTLQNNLPKLPAIDSIALSVSGNTTFVGPVGGNFPNNAVHAVTGDFVVLVRNVSVSSGDSIRLCRTAGRTATNTAVAASFRYGEGAGFVNYAKQFVSTTNFVSKGFGAGTDHEFCVAPRVQYTLTSSHQPDASDTRTLCAWDALTFTSTSSPRFLNEQFNLVEFGRKWGHNPPFAQNTLQLMTASGLVNVFSQDSSITWYFAPEDSGDPNSLALVHLPYLTVTHTISFVTDSAFVSKVNGDDSTVCFTTNEFRTRFKTMALKGGGILYSSQEPFSLCTSFCGRVHPGIQGSGSAAPGLRIGPNPCKDWLMLEGAGQFERISIMDACGRRMMDVNADPGIKAVYLGELPAGLYVLQVITAEAGYFSKFLKE